MTQDVVIVGAGPVGLLLGIELVMAGSKPLVLERLAEPDRTIKAAGVGAVAVEALQRRGMAGALDDEYRAAMERFMPHLKARFGPGPIKKPAGHFSGMFLLDQSLQRDPERHLRPVPQEALERILAERARELGLEVRRGVTVEGFEQEADSVTVHTSQGPLLAQYLVGCDGGRSGVRKLAGFEFPGTDPTITGYQAIVELAAPEKLAPGWQRTPRGFIVSMPGGRVFAAELSGPPPDRDAPITLAEVEAVFRRVSGTDLEIRSMSMPSRWTDNARLATTYRLGRVLLAGDAAHVHSAFGGQGLNLGLVDAANLGFKLAAAVKGRDQLLDSYTAERQPVAARVLENTRAQVALMRPDPLTTALRNIVGDLMRLPEGNRYISEMLSGVDIRYQLGDDDPLVGSLAKDQVLSLADGTEQSLYALMVKGGGLFIAPNERPLPSGVQHAHTKSGPSLLLRPDACIAWTDSSSKALDDVLARWF